MIAVSLRLSIIVVLVASWAAAPARGEPDPEPPTSELPYRVLGPKLSLDLSVDTGYRHWIPQQYPTIDVVEHGYFTWSVSLRARLFRFLSLHHGYYESSSVTSPHSETGVVVGTAGRHLPKAAWAMAHLGFPISRAWEPVLRVEARAIETAARPRVPVCVVGREETITEGACAPSTDPFDVVSGYETIVLGVRYNPAAGQGAVLGAGARWSIHGGAGLLSYVKPIQNTVGAPGLRDLLFDGRFRGGGIAIGGAFDLGTQGIFAHANGQLGMGRVVLARGLDLTDVVPSGWRVGYLQGDGALGWRFIILRGPPTLILQPWLSAHVFRLGFVTSPAHRGFDADPPALGWDFLWSARAAVVIPL